MLVLDLCLVGLVVATSHVSIVTRRVIMFDARQPQYHNSRMSETDRQTDNGVAKPCNRHYSA